MTTNPLHGKPMESLVLPCKMFFWFSFFFKVSKVISRITKLTNTRNSCTYLNALFMVIPNPVIKLNNFEIFKQFCDILDLLSVHACHVLDLLVDYFYQQTHETRTSQETGCPSTHLSPLYTEWYLPTLSQNALAIGQQTVRVAPHVCWWGFWPASSCLELVKTVRTREMVKKRTKY